MSLTPPGVKVSVSEGVVALEGVVKDRSEKRLAVRLIEDLPGVRAVHNHLSVRKSLEGWIRPGLIKGVY